MFSEWLWSQQTQRENPSNSLNKKTQLTHQTDVQKNSGFLQVWNNEAGADGGEMADLSFGIFSEDFATDRLELPNEEKVWDVFSIGSIWDSWEW